MAITVLAHIAAGSTNGGTSVTTSAISTTGASLIVVHASTFNSVGAGTVSDSAGNTWTGLTEQSSAPGGITRSRLWYVVAPTTSASHTFTISGATNFPSIAVIALSGTLASTPFDVENGANNSGTTTSIQPGSVTPSADNAIVIAGLSADGSGAGVTTLTLADATDHNGGNAIAGGLAYQIQTTATAVNPTWSWITATSASTAIAVFLAATGGGGGDLPFITTIGAMRAGAVR